MDSSVPGLIARTEGTMLRAAPAKPCSVLIAEDDPSIRALLSTALRRQRVNFSTVADGRQAVRMLERERWMVLILDLMMPTMTGWEVVAWLAAHREHKPGTVIVVSATERELLRELDPTVVNAIIFKPFDILQLGAYVKASCALSHDDRRQSRMIGTPV
jgi:DNA-binding response OmpR family regulator